jgi:hypothetical protein
MWAQYVKLPHLKQLFLRLCEGVPSWPGASFEGSYVGSILSQRIETVRRRTECFEDSYVDSCCSGGSGATTL